MVLVNPGPERPTENTADMHVWESSSADDAETLTKLAAAKAEVLVLREPLAEVTRTRDSFERR
jgi:hypothetical protein